MGRIGIDDDFFELGGDQGWAAAVAERIAESCDTTLDAGMLSVAPTIRELAAMLTGAAGAEPDGSCRAMSDDEVIAGLKPRFFFLHGDLFGGGLYCHRLARALSTTVALHVLAPCRPDASGPQRVAEMADHHLRKLRAVQPHGPYLLGGFCLGGVIAFEMARRLQAQGETVSRLVLVAPRVWSRYWGLRRLSGWVGRRLSVTPERERAFFAALIEAGQPWLERLDLARARLTGQPTRGLAVPARLRWILSNRAARLLRRRRGHAPSAPEPAPLTPAAAACQSREARRREWWPVVVRANRDWVPARYDGHLIILWPEDDIIRRPGDPEASWRGLVRTLEVHRIPGGHNDAPGRHTSALAERLRACLAPG